MKTFLFTGEISYPATIAVEAETEEEARELVGMGEFEIRDANDEFMEFIDKGYEVEIEEE
jgi:hypothetical protein